MIKGGIPANEVKPLAGPLQYREGTALPRLSGVVNYGTAKHSAEVMERKKYVVPALEVTGDTDTFTLPETCRRSWVDDSSYSRIMSIEAYVQGVRVEMREELTSNRIRIGVVPAIGDEVVFNYAPYSNTGGNAKRQSKVVVLDADHNLTRDEVLVGSVVFENNTPIDVDLPALTEIDDGTPILLMRSGWGLVTLTPSGGTTINGLVTLDIELPWVSFELLWDHRNLNWIPFF